MQLIVPGCYGDEMLRPVRLNLLLLATERRVHLGKGPNSKGVVSKGQFWSTCPIM